MSESAHFDQGPWYVGAYNGLGAAASAIGLRGDQAFRPEALRQGARRRAIGSYDFGAPPLDEPLRRLSEDFLAESHASQTGRTAMREHLLELLAARLRLTGRWHQPRNVGALEPVERPVFIFGLPRTGTTLLHNLIAQDPQVRVPWTFEVMMPTPQPGALSRGARRAAVAKRLQWVHRLAPAFRTVHEVSASLPQECIAITAYTLQSIEFHTTHRLPGYQNWLEGSDQVPAYAFHRRFLQHLQAEDREAAGSGPFAPRPWVLKAPGHLFALDALLAVYPDAVLVQTHRDPLEVVASISSHGVILRKAFSQQVDVQEVAVDWSNRWGRALARTMARRQADASLDQRVLDLHYSRLLADPMGVIADLYAHAGLSLGDLARERMQGYLASNPQGRHGRHRYSLEGFGLNPHQEAERYADYRRWLNIA
ncbi:MAG: sulfotransferase [Pseudomonadota bacterium]